MIPFVYGMQCVFAAVSFSSSARCSSFMHRRFNSSVQWMCVINFGQATEGCMLPEENGWVSVLNLVCEVLPTVSLCCCLCCGADRVCGHGRRYATGWKMVTCLQSSEKKKKGPDTWTVIALQGEPPPQIVYAPFQTLWSVVGCCQPFSRDQITSSSDSWTSPIIQYLLPYSGHPSW